GLRIEQYQAHFVAFVYSYSGYLCAFRIQCGGEVPALSGKLPVGFLPEIIDVDYAIGALAVAAMPPYLIPYDFACGVCEMRFGLAACFYHIRTPAGGV